jgi:hypothetical protein
LEQAMHVSIPYPRTRRRWRCARLGLVRGAEVGQSAHGRAATVTATD